MELTVSGRDTVHVVAPDVSTDSRSHHAWPPKCSDSTGVAPSRNAVGLASATGVPSKKDTSLRVRSSNAWGVLSGSSYNARNCANVMLCVGSPASDVPTSLPGSRAGSPTTEYR